VSTESLDQTLLGPEDHVKVRASGLRWVQPHMAAAAGSASVCRWRHRLPALQPSDHIRQVRPGLNAVCLAGCDYRCTSSLNFIVAHPCATRLPNWTALDWHRCANTEPIVRVARAYSDRDSELYCRAPCETRALLDSRFEPPTPQCAQWPVR
jgi:hypothetical protein